MTQRELAHSCYACDCWASIRMHSRDKTDGIDYVGLQQQLNKIKVKISIYRDAKSRGGINDHVEIEITVSQDSRRYYHLVERALTRLYPSKQWGAASAVLMARHWEKIEFGDMHGGRYSRWREQLGESPEAMGARVYEEIARMEALPATPEKTA